MLSTPAPLVYRIDDDDRVCFVNGAWLADNGGLSPETLLGRTLWDFVHEGTVVALYRQMLVRAREGRMVRFHYRCDTPEARRLYRMSITALADGTVEFCTVLRREERRPKVLLLDVAQAPRGDALVKICSWCERAEVAEGEWAPVEKAVETLGLMERHPLPRLTHGICARCLGRMMRSLDRLAAGQGAGPA